MLVTIDSTNRNGNRGFLSHATVQILFKGIYINKIQINSGGFTSAGGEYLIPGKTYLIFAYIRKGIYYAFICDDKSTQIYQGDHIDDWSKERIDRLKIASEWAAIKDKKYTGYYEYKLFGKLIAKGHYKKGLPHGTWEYYKKDNDLVYRLYAIRNYAKGKLDGIQEVRDYSLQFIEIESLYDHDSVVASKIYYRHRPGQTRCLANSTAFFTLEGMKMESTISYDTSHIITSIVNYVHTGIKYNSNLFFLNKIKHGHYKYIDKYEKTITEGDYYMGSRSGKWTISRIDGKLISEENYLENKPINDTLVLSDCKGHLVKGAIKNNEPTGTWIFHDENRHGIYPFVNGKIHGLVIEAYKDQTIYTTYKKDEKDGYSYILNNVSKDTLNKTTYANGERSGEEIIYHQNGQLHRVTHFDHGFRMGTELVYTNNGTLIKRVNYDKDLMHGQYEEYDSDGILIEKGEYYQGLRSGHWYGKNQKKVIHYVILRTKNENFLFSITEDEFSQYERDPEYEVVKR
jgi:antitoxin component YwqK of YwqJK toxin-antitoxin module